MMIVGLQFSFDLEQARVGQVCASLFRACRRLDPALKLVLARAAEDNGPFADEVKRLTGKGVDLLMPEPGRRWPLGRRGTMAIFQAADDDTVEALTTRHWRCNGGNWILLLSAVDYAAMLARLKGLGVVAIAHLVLRGDLLLSLQPQVFACGVSYDDDSLLVSVSSEFVERCYLK